jgi:diguanylate cyclase (GGDEF)-like protein
MRHIYLSLRIAPFMLGLLSVLLGGFALFNGYAQLFSLSMINESWIDMHTDTAICFIIAGMSLITLYSTKRHMIHVLGGLTFTIGFISLLQYIVAANFGLNFFSTHMSPNSSLIFSLAGIALVLLGRRANSSVTFLTAITVSLVMLCLGIIALCGYLAEIPGTYGWGEFTAMSFFTSCGVIGLSVGIIGYAWMMASKNNISPLCWMHWFVLITAVTTSLLIWQAFNAYIHQIQMQGIAQTTHSFLPSIILLAGFLTSGILSLMTYLAYRAIQGTIAAKKEIVKREEIEKKLLLYTNKLEELALLDSLTGLGNRRYLLQSLSKEMVLLQKTQMPLSVLLLDIDFFKKINDTHGHVIGDTVLQQLGHILQANIRGTDTVSRYGGEEFCIVLGNTSITQAVVVAEKLRACIANAKFTISTNLSLRLTCSIGVCQVRSNIKAINDIFTIVDSALYKAKNMGRNRVYVEEKLLQAVKSQYITAPRFAVKPLAEVE